MTVIGRTTCYQIYLGKLEVITTPIKYVTGRIYEVSAEVMLY